MVSWKPFWLWLQKQLAKIKTKLFLTYFILLILSISLVGFTSSFYAQQSIKEKIEQGNQLLLNQIQRNLDSKFLQTKSLLFAPYYSTDLVTEINQYRDMSPAEKYIFINEFSDYLLTSLYVSQQPDYVGFQIFHPSEGLLYTTPGVSPGELEASYQNDDWLEKTIQKNGQAYISKPYQDELRDNERLLYSASIMVRDYPDFTGNYFILRIEYEFEYIETISQNSNISENSDIVVLNAEDELIYSTDNLFASENYQDMVDNIKAQSGQFWFEQETESFHISYKRLEEVDWRLFLLTPQQDVVGPTLAIRNITVIVGLIALFITAGISYFISRKITEPILNLYDTLSGKKKKEKTKRKHLNKQKDELDYITESVNDMVKENQKLLTAEYTYKIKLRESELANLYAQINPHFLYNTLDMIRAMASSYKADNIATMTLSLADMLRYSTKTKGDFVKVKEEVSHIKDYLTIQKLRFESKIEYDIQVSEQALEEYMLKMTLQPLVENAVFHGLERKKGKGYLLIKVDCDENFLYFVIKDSGAGMPADKLMRARIEFQHIRQTLEMTPEQGLGIGLSNVFTRYVIQYKDGFEFNLESKEGEGTAIWIKISRNVSEKSDL